MVSFFVERGMPKYLKGKSPFEHLKFSNILACLSNRHAIKIRSSFAQISLQPGHTREFIESREELQNCCHPLKTEAGHPQNKHGLTKAFRMILKKAMNAAFRKSYSSTPYILQRDRVTWDHLVSTFF